MNLEQYKYSTNETFLNFEFDSEGPKGKIRKGVRFSIENDFGVTFFNMAFGNLDEKPGKLDDLVVSNNQDRGKILTTIAAIVIDFTEKFSDIMLYVKGSTQSRTRLYQMGITANLDEIESMFYIFGFNNAEWNLVEKKVNYKHFLHCVKNLKFVVLKR